MASQPEASGVPDWARLSCLVSALVWLWGSLLETGDALAKTEPGLIAVSIALAFWVQSDTLCLAIPVQVYGR